MACHNYNGYAYYASLYQDDFGISGCPFVISNSGNNLIFQILRDIEFSFTEVKDKELLIEIYAIKHTNHPQNSTSLLDYLKDSSNNHNINNHNIHLFKQFRVKLSDYLENPDHQLKLNIIPYNDSYFACNPCFTVSKKEVF